MSGHPGTDNAGTSHVEALTRALPSLNAQLPLTTRWGRHLAEVLPRGHRVLAAGNGGSAAQAQHLTAELVGRYCADRRPFAAVALHAETSAFTAILNDYGPEAVFARGVEAHGRPGDVCVLMSTSGRSANILAAARAARSGGLTTWALTGSAPNPLADICDETLAIDAETTATVQELHLVALHLVCESMDAELQRLDPVAHGFVSALKVAE